MVDDESKEEEEEEEEEDRAREKGVGRSGEERTKDARARRLLGIFWNHG